MKQVQIELPEKMADQIEALVRGGWFHDEHELIRTALAAFLQDHQLELTERYQREDIDWAVQQRTAKP